MTDYAALAKRLRASSEYLAGAVEAEVELSPFSVTSRNASTLGITDEWRAASVAMEEAADAIEALTSPPDEGTGGFRVSGVGKIKEI